VVYIVFVIVKREYKIFGTDAKLIVDAEYREEFLYEQHVVFHGNNEGGVGPKDKNNSKY